MFVYIIQALDNPNFTKVGVSRNPNTRLAQIQAYNYNLLSLRHFVEINTEQNARWIEEIFKINCKSKRTFGEWFKMTLEESVEELERIISAPILGKCRV